MDINLINKHNNIRLNEGYNMDDTIMDIILHPLTSLLLGITVIVMGMLMKNGVIDIKKIGL